MTWHIILETEDRNWERMKVLLGWAAKSSAWVEPTLISHLWIGAQTTLTELKYCSSLFETYALQSF